MGETFKSGMEILKKGFEQGTQEMMEKDIDKMSTPEEVNSYVPLNIVVNDRKYRTFESPYYMVQEALDKQGFLNIGFFQHERSCHFRDHRLMRPISLKDLQQVVVLKGKIYSRELDLFKDPSGSFKEITLENLKSLVSSGQFI